MTELNAEALEGLLKEAAELPNPKTNLLTHNERELIDFCQQLASALRASAAREAKLTEALEECRDLTSKGTLSALEEIGRVAAAALSALPSEEPAHDR
ncbi:hypothetical protein ABEG18_13230 [Alsobacter sp. KACC 23698]|uniref:Uncharacterized protein n=1 Tax=Alsobacter sp. KACC 23698 TaxID=3149229 RepID=A0AAU7J9D9_9HYPH